MSPARFDRVLAAMRRRAVVVRATELAEEAADIQRRAALRELSALNERQVSTGICTGGLSCRCGHGTNTEGSDDVNTDLKWK